MVLKNYEMLGPAKFATDSRGLGERVGPRDWGESEGGALVTGYLRDVQCVHTIGLSTCFHGCVCQLGVGWVSRINQFCVYSGFHSITNDSMFCT